MPGIWVSNVLGYASFRTGGTTNAVTVYTIPGSTSDYWYIEEVVLERITDFAGGSINACTVQIGKSGATAKYLAASTNVFTGAKASAVRTVGSNTAAVNPAHLEAGQTEIQVKMTSGAANLSALTAGQLAVHIKLGRIPRPA